MRSPTQQTAKWLRATSVGLFVGELTLWFLQFEKLPRELLGGELLRCALSIPILGAYWRTGGPWRWPAVVVVGFGFALVAPGLFMVTFALTEPSGIGVGFARFGWAPLFCLVVSVFAVIGIFAFRLAQQRERAEPRAAPDPAT